MSNTRSEGRPEPGLRSQYVKFMPVQTRWKDNDVYGHVNNVEYYSYFDTVVNRYLIDPGGLDFHNAPIVGIMAETMCRFHRSFAPSPSRKRRLGLPIPASQHGSRHPRGAHAAE